MVLCHTPGLIGKLHSIWEGSYEVLVKLSDCNYKIGVPEQRYQHLVVYVNRLKEWRTPVANLFRVVVTDEIEGTTDPVGKVKMGVPVLSDFQQIQLQEIKDEFSDVVTTELVMTKHDVHEIDTGESKPIRSVPYRIAPAWRAELKEEIQLLVRDGILVPSKNSWSFPMVPVRKKETNALDSVWITGG